MKIILFGKLIALTGLLLLSLNAAFVQANEEPRMKTESPYFYIPGGEQGVDELPLKATDVDVKISGIIADVTVVQHYRNEGKRPIEAKYVFPGSTKAAVYAMNVRLADRLIVANIREKQQARQEYQQAQEEGRTAALLEEHLPNVFQMNVANIMPGDDVRVELHYTELLVPQSGHYQFVFPTVVGPRYNSPNASAESSKVSARAVNIPYLRSGNADVAKFSLKSTLISPIGIKSLSSPSHKLRTTVESDKKMAHIELENGDSLANRDVILDYQLAGDNIESGIMLYQGQDENFFLAMVEPPKKVAKEIVPPRDYLFVVDISGSMEGFPLNTAKQVIKELMKGMRPDDTFNVMLFSGSSSTLAPYSVQATPINITRAMEMLQTYYGSGSTELIPALKHVYQLPKPEGLSRTVVIVTDGYVSVEREAFDLVRQNLNKANVFSIGIGSSVNRYLIEGLARAGMGEPFIVTSPDQAAQQAKRFHNLIAYPALTDVKARFEGLDAYDIEPQVLPDVLGERPVVLFGKWKGQAQGNIIIEGRNAQGVYKNTLPVAVQNHKDTEALRYLWARSRIDNLMDKESLTTGSPYKDEITSLGLKYNLLTPYTSFIAVDNVVRNQDPTQQTSVTQPTPMPEGVSDAAIPQQPANSSHSSGSFLPSTPEPEFIYALLLVGGILVLMAGFRRQQLKP